MREMKEIKINQAIPSLIKALPLVKSEVASFHIPSHTYKVTIIAAIIQGTETTRIQPNVSIAQLIAITTINGWTHQKPSQQRLKTHF